MSLLGPDLLRRMADEPGAVSIREHGRTYNARMSRRRPTKAERERFVSLDLLADWRVYAEPLPAKNGDHDWRYFGTITMDGETGALAWRAGGYGVGNGTTVRELGLWDRIKVESLLMDDPPGHSDAPRFTPLAFSVWPKERR